METTHKLGELTSETARWADFNQQLSDLREMTDLASEQDDSAFIEDIDNATTVLENEFREHLVSLALNGPTTTGQPSSPSRPARAAPKPSFGPKCSKGCTGPGQRGPNARCRP